MKTIYLVPAFAGALLFSTAAIAATGEYDNMCTMGLALGKKVDTDCSISGMIGGKTYCFGNQDAKTMFMKDPEGNRAKARSFYNDNQ
jgi:YHS domain-containing protein